MALSRHDLLRPLESLRSADGLEPVRGVAERMPQELIEAAATPRIGGSAAGRGRRGGGRRVPQAERERLDVAVTEPGQTHEGA